MNEMHKLLFYEKRALGIGDENSLISCNICGMKYCSNFIPLDSQFKKVHFVLHLMRKSIDYDAKLEKQIFDANEIKHLNIFLYPEGETWCLKKVSNICMTFCETENNDRFLNDKSLCMDELKLVSDICFEDFGKNYNVSYIYMPFYFDELAEKANRQLYYFCRLCGKSYEVFPDDIIISSHIRLCISELRNKHIPNTCALTASRDITTDAQN